MLILLFFSVSLGANKLLIWSCLIIFYFNFLACIRKPLQIVSGIKTYIKIDVFFMLFFYIIYYYPYQLYVLGLKNLNQTKFLDATYSEYANKAIIMSTIGLLAFQLGYQYFNANLNHTIIHQISKKYYRLLIGTILFFIVLILIIFAKTGMTTLFAGAYVGSKMGSATYDAIFGLVTYFVLLGVAESVYSYVINKKLTLNILIFSAVALAWTIALMVIGDRNTFFLVSVVALAGIFTYMRGISRKQIIVGIFAALFLYQIIEISRVSESRNLTSLLDAFSTVTNESEGELEIGSFDITTIGNRATYKVTENRGVFYGKFKLISLASIFPYSSRLFVDPNDVFTGSSNILKDEMIGLNKTWGVGTNIISDCYLDFGFLGVIIIMFGIGRFGGYVKTNAQRNINSPKWMFIYIITLGYYSELARYGFDFPLRSIAWTYLLFFFLDKMLKSPKSVIDDVDV